MSFVDCPGHDVLMATMLNGAAVMDAAFLLVAANEPCPQPQTSEHLAAVEIMKLRHLLILQNKIDLVRESQAREQAQQIAKFVEGASSSLGLFLFYFVDSISVLPKQCSIPTHRHCGRQGASDSDLRAAQVQR